MLIREFKRSPRTASPWRVLSFFMFAVLISLPAEARGQQGATIHGRITEASGAPVPDALITLTRFEGGPARRTAATAEDGEYHLSDIAPGVYRLQVQRIGFHALEDEVRLAPGEVKRLDLTLTVEVVAMDPLIVRGARSAGRERMRFESDAGLTARLVTSQEVKRLPGLAEADVLRAVEVLPGVVSTSDFSSAFNVRAAPPTRT